MRNSKDLITCTHCGIVQRGHICPYKKQWKKKEFTEQNKFRNTKAWQNKREEICRRDKYLCKVCMANLYNTISTLNYKNLEVHHIISLADDYSKRLDNDNLITLCSYHHKMAEKGEIPREELLKLASPPAQK